MSIARGLKGIARHKAIQAHRLDAYIYHLDRLMAGTTKPGFVTYRWNKVRESRKNASMSPQGI